MPKAPYQDGLTIITEILPGQEEALADALHQIESDIEENPLVPFKQLQTIHFARWVILPPSVDARGRPTPASLIFSTNFDEPVEKHLEELYEKAGAGLDLIYSCCAGYPPPDGRTKAGVIRYLQDHEAGYHTLYVGTRGRTVPQVQREAELREAIQRFLDEATRRPEFLEQKPEKIRADIQQFVRSQPELRWAEEPPPSPRRLWPRPGDGILLAPATALVLLPYLIGVLGSALAGLLVLLRQQEQRDEQYPATTDYDHVRRLVEREDVRSEGRPIVQNQMSSVTNIKPGWLRQVTLRGVLWVIDAAGRYVYTKGQLGTIPSIHFARWVIIDDGRRLLFFSNFDGSWENYLGDFIDKAATGLTAVWSNTYGFPRTRWLINDGATDEQRFKAYARNSQVVTQVWYSAYKRLSVQNINNNSRIRAGLFGPQTPEETAAWLQLL